MELLVSRVGRAKGSIATSEATGHPIEFPFVDAVRAIDSGLPSPREFGVAAGSRGWGPNGRRIRLVQDVFASGADYISVSPTSAAINITYRMRGAGL